MFEQEHRSTLGENKSLNMLKCTHHKCVFFPQGQISSPAPAEWDKHTTTNYFPASNLAIHKILQSKILFILVVIIIFITAVNLIL